MRSKLKIFYVSSEVAPFAKESQLADVAGAFPKYIKNLGHDIRVMMPNYKVINERKYVLRDVIRLQGLTIQIGEKMIKAYGKSAFIPNSKVQVYFLNNKDYFERDGLYSDTETATGYTDNAERYLFFSIGCLETLKLLHWQPDIIHCNDWQTALIPVLLKTIYRDDEFFKDSKTLLSIHNCSEYGNFKSSLLKETGLFDNFKDVAPGNSHFSFLDTGVQYADMLISMNPAPGKIKDQSNVYNIANAIDAQVWNPSTDRMIPANFTAEKLDGKLENKKKLLEYFDLHDESIPVIGIISKLSTAKGIDLIIDIAEKLVAMNVHLFIHGPVEAEYKTRLENLAKKNKGVVGIRFGSDNTLEHLLIAGGDFMLMPWRDASCNLTQLYALSYGTIPIVSDIGGISDMISEFEPKKQTGNGFLLSKPAADELLRVVRKALSHYSDKDAWLKLRQNAMNQDFSWSSAIQDYVKLYQKLMSGKASKK